MGKINTNTKSRWWACIVWPDSTPNFREVLTELHIPCAISPIHDKDKDETGSGKKYKKEHFHVLFQYGNTTTYKHMNELITNVISTPTVVPISSARGYYRYLTHADNPEKAQYDFDDITYLNGFDTNEVRSDGDIENLIIEISKICLAQKICSYKSLYAYLLNNSLYEYAKVVQHNTLHFKALCSSNKFVEKLTKS